MGTLISTIIIGVSLSMDAFSLALFYGTIGLNKIQKFLLSFIVGGFHFFMPLIGLFFGNIITSYFFIDLGLLVSIIFFIIGIEMIISSIKDDDVRVLVSIFGFILFGFSVSIDSFTTGIGLNIINSNYLQVSLIFSLVSGLFTYLGLILGYKLNQSYGKYATLVGGFILIILGIYYLL